MCKTSQYDSSPARIKEYLAVRAFVWIEFNNVHIHVWYVGVFVYMYVYVYMYTYGL